MATQNRGTVVPWQWHAVNQDAVLEWEELTLKRNRDGDPISEAFELTLSQDVLVYVVRQLPRTDLPHVRRVCRGMREAVDWVWHFYYWKRGVSEARYPKLDWTSIELSAPRIHEALQWPSAAFEWWSGGAPIVRFVLSEYARAREWLDQNSRTNCRDVTTDPDNGAPRMSVACLRMIKTWWDCNLCLALTRNGMRSVILWVRAARPDLQLSKYVCEYAAAGGHTSLMLEFYNHVRVWEGTARAAASGGHLATLRAAKSHGCHWDESTCSAAYGRHEHVLRWVHQGSRWKGYGWPCTRYPCAWMRARWAEEK